MLCKPNHDAFMDNLVSAYMNLDARRGGTNMGLLGSEYLKLIRMICIDFPEDVVELILDTLGKKESDVVSFEEFV